MNRTVSIDAADLVDLDLLDAALLILEAEDRQLGVT